MRALVVVLLVIGCGPAAPAPKPPPPPPPPPPPAARPLSIVTSFVVLEACTNAKQLDTRRAQKEIEELVGPCTKVPGGAAHFSAILKPGGAVELASPEGDPTMGVVPTCLLQSQNQLRHKLRLTGPCKFDVRLEQR